MKIWLGISVVLLGLCFWAYKAVDRSGDDFGAVLPLLLLLAITATNWLLLALVAMRRAGS